jgi:hypothetical protein
MSLILKRYRLSKRPVEQHRALTPPQLCDPATPAAPPPLPGRTCGAAKPLLLGSR